MFIKMYKKLLFIALFFLPVFSFASAPQFNDYQAVCTNTSCYIEGTIYISQSGTARVTFTPDQDIDIEIWLDAESTGTLLYSKPGYFKQSVQVTINLTSAGFDIQEGANTAENVSYSFNQNVSVQLIIVIKNSSSEKATKNLTLFVDTQPPESPTGVYANPGDRNAIVHWNQSSSTDVKYYKVYYRIEGETEFLLSGNTATNSETSFTVGGLENGVTYEFGVSAVDKVLNEGTVRSVQDDGQPVKATPTEIIGLHGLSPEEEGGCFIATAVYSEESQEVKILRKFRDNFLMNNLPGKLFVKLYYKFSPPVAEFIRNHVALKIAGRIVLAPIVFFAGIVIRYPMLPFFSLILLFSCALFYRRVHN
jgi:hypothetical protein